MKHNLILFLLGFSLIFSSESNASNIRLFTGNANPELAKEVAQLLDVPLGKATVDNFNDGEIKIKIEENIRNAHTFIMQPTCTAETSSVNDNLMELMLMIRTMKRASAKSVTAVTPYYGYARQDRKEHSRVPISASDIAMLLETAGADRVLALDLHCGQIQGFFHNIPVDNLAASRVFIPYFAEKGLENPVVVSPDAGGVSRAKVFKDGLAKRGVNADLAIIVKQRGGAGVIDSVHLVGDVNGADAIIIDDLCDTAGTLCKAAEELKKRGAKRVFACITHPVFSGPAHERIENSVLTEMVVTDTIPIKGKAPSNLKRISVAPLFADAIKRIESGESVSDLFL